MKRISNLNLEAPDGDYSDIIDKVIKMTESTVKDGMIIMPSIFDDFEMKKDGAKYRVSVLSMGGDVSIIIKKKDARF